MLTKEHDNFFNLYSHTDPILNWRLHLDDSFAGSNYTMANGYYESSVHLIKECINNNNDKKADFWIFPIMFCVNQFIELYLKGIIAQTKQYDRSLHSDYSIDISDGSHNINKLATTLFNWQHSKNNVFIAHLSDLKIIIDFTEILKEQKGYDLTFARYPSAKNSDDNTNAKKPNLKQFYNSNYENCGLNLKLYLEWVKVIYDILDGTSMNIYKLIENQGE